LVFRSVLVRLTDPKNRHVIIYTWTLGGVQTFKSSYLDVSLFFSTFSFLLCLHSHARTFLLVTLGSGWGAIVTGLEGSSILKVAIPKGYVNSFFHIHFSFLFASAEPFYILRHLCPPALYCSQYYYHDYTIIIIIIIVSSKKITPSGFPFVLQGHDSFPQDVNRILKFHLNNTTVNQWMALSWK